MKARGRRDIEKKGRAVTRAPYSGDAFCWEDIGRTVSRRC